MRTSHRLDLVVVPSRGHQESLQALWRRLRDARVVRTDGSPDEAAERWVEGSFRRMSLDLPGATTLYGNRQGGFRVLCPQTDAIITGAFSKALTAARAGASWALDCPACGTRHLLDDVVGRPPFAIGDAALVTADAGAAALSAQGRAWIEETLGAARVVLRRG